MSDPTDERWLPVVGYEGKYEVSDLGRVWSVPRTITIVSVKGSYERPIRGRIMKTPVGSHGYPEVRLATGGPCSPSTVHTLVAAAFIGPCPDGQEVRHLDGTRTNCAVMNLAYGTRSDNNLDAVRHGTHHWAAKTHCPRGHVLLPFADKRGRTHRQCAECPPILKRLWYERQKGIA